MIRVYKDTICVGDNLLIDINEFFYYYLFNVFFCILLWQVIFRNRFALSLDWMDLKWLYALQSMGNLLFAD